MFHTCTSEPHDNNTKLKNSKSFTQILFDIHALAQFYFIMNNTHITKVHQNITNNI